MNKPVIAAVTVLLAMLAVACGGDDNAGSTTTATAAASATSTATAKPTASSDTPDATHLASTKFDPKISLTAPGWKVSEDAGNSFLVEHEGAAYASIYFLKVINVTNPDTLRRETAPDDLAAWLRAHPSLNVLNDDNVVVLGRPAVQLDVATSTTHDVELFPQGQGTIALYQEDAARIIVIGEGTGQFLIMIGTGQPPDIERSLQVAQPVMESLQIN